MNERLAELRRRLEKTQTEMADLFGVHLRTYQAWEYGRRRTSAAVRTLIDKVARAHHVKIEELPEHAGVRK